MIVSSLWPSEIRRTSYQYLSSIQWCRNRGGPCLGLLRILPQDFRQYQIAQECAMGLLGNCCLRLSASHSFLLVSILLCPLTQSLTKNLVSSAIPEITDADMAFQAEETHANDDIKPFRKQ